MPTYQYEAMDSTGMEVKDAIDAPSEADAQTMIRQKGFFVTKITEKGRGKKDKDKKGSKKAAAQQKKKTFSFGRVSAKQLCTFTRQLSTLQDAGLPILRSLRILEGQARPGPLKNSLMNVIDEVESGSTLSEAMSKQPKCFDNLYVNMVRAGEAGGALEIILQRLAEFKERSQSLKRKVQGAMIYPCAVILVATSIVGFIMYWIIPKFKAIFDGFNMTLPIMTVMLIKVSDWVVNYFYLIPAIPFVIWLMKEQDGRVHHGSHLSQDSAAGEDSRKEYRRPYGKNSGNTDLIGRPHSGSVNHRQRHGRKRRLRQGLQSHL